MVSLYPRSGMENIVVVPRGVARESEDGSVCVCVGLWLIKLRRSNSYLLNFLRFSYLTKFNLRNPTPAIASLKNLAHSGEAGGCVICGSTN